MEIYEVLKKDHKLVKSLLKDMEDSSDRAGKKRKQLLMKLKMALIPHARAEEEVLYEALKESDVKKADDLGYEGYEEHAVSDRLLMELEQTDPADKRWAALLSVLKETLEHHIEEEEKEMFKAAKKSFSKEEATEMSEQFLELKKKAEKLVAPGETIPQASNHSIEA